MRPFLCSYGGGHAQIMLAVCRELDRRQTDYDLMGFTTAHSVFANDGLEPLDVGALLERGEVEERVAELGELVPASGHPAITQSQTNAYFAAGYWDLEQQLGKDAALDLVRVQGRKAFEPVKVFERYFSRINPSVVVATSSPRFELAALLAARNLGIPSIAIGDVLRVDGQEWLEREGFADHMTVISPEVAENLRGAGLSDVELHPLGNPAFDALAPTLGDNAKRSAIRRDFGLEGHHVILWPLGGSTDLVAGRYLLQPEEVQKALDGFCSRNPDHRYILRPHPNWPVAPIKSEFGLVDATLTAEEALLAADVVCVESSTLGLQAVLRGIPAICLNFADYVVYPQLGWALAVDSLDELLESLEDRSYFAAPESARSLVGSSSAAVADLIESVALSG